MSTLVADVTISESTTKDRRDLARFRGTYGDIKQREAAKHSLDQGEDVTITFSRFIFLYFPKPTLITFTVGSGSVEITVNGTLVLPCAGSIHVEHTSSSATDPIVFDYVKS